MPSVHRPDINTYYKEPEACRDAGTKYKRHYMWPHIDQEDLSDARPLLLLLNARGRHPLSAFAAANIVGMRFGFTSRAIVPNILNRHVLKRRTPGSMQFMPEEGLLVLEAERKILAFLEKCCRLIHLDIPEDTIVSDSLPIQPEPQLKRESELTGFDSLAVMAVEAPYRVPAKLNLDRIYSLLHAKASAAEDHLWSLRENPGYFTSTFHDTKEHRLEIIKDWNGGTHPE
ncbi:hypothetical protein ASPCAL02292 [Aspergillus calidoustus]|uniref:Uncharacterized protein n=1 Tax=Aspergillus calidoustus TaxID=454130 RepID=A0A0U5GMH4_ASPCI|nr:hypothetical protein ASPCAL02292 [Aspergillus calidoustus]